MGIHKSHKKVRASYDASSYDMICDDCGATDRVIGGWGLLGRPCTAPKPFRIRKSQSTGKFYIMARSQVRLHQYRLVSTGHKTVADAMASINRYIAATVV